MSMKIRPEMATILRERAGLDLDTFTDTLLSDALAYDPDDLSEVKIAEIRVGIQNGLDAVAAGRVRSAQEYKANVQTAR